MLGMNSLVTAAMDSWSIEIVAVVRSAYSSIERRSISRDVERGLLVRLLPGAYVERSAYAACSPEEQHVVRMRALAAVSGEPVVFSHWSAAVLHGLPVSWSRLDRLHVTAAHDDERHRVGIGTHVFLLSDPEVVAFGDLLATGAGRTVVDVAGASPFEEGVAAADGLLRAGMPRELLEAAVDLAGPRRATRRIDRVVAFADPGAESAGESRMRVVLMRLGVEVPELQHPVELRSRATAYLDAYLRSAVVGIEVDGDAKYLDPRMAPEGAGRALVAEKRREDEVRLDLRGLVRPSWAQTGSTAAMRALLLAVGVRPTRPRTSFAAYCERARRSRPRFVPRVRAWRA